MGVKCSASLGCVLVISTGGGVADKSQLNEMGEGGGARLCRQKECRIFFLRCHVVKLWRVLYQEERLNFLPLGFFLSPPLSLLFL